MHDIALQQENILVSIGLEDNHVTPYYLGPSKTSQCQPSSCFWSGMEMVLLNGLNKSKVVLARRYVSTPASTSCSDTALPRHELKLLSSAIADS